MTHEECKDCIFYERRVCVNWANGKDVPKVDANGKTYYTIEIDIAKVQQCQEKTSKAH